MIALARSGRIKRFAQTARATSFLSGKYVSGRTPEAGILRAQALLEEAGMRASCFTWGNMWRIWIWCAGALTTTRGGGAAVQGRVGCTCLGRSDPYRPLPEPGGCGENAERLARAVVQAAGGRDGVHCLMFDMEDSSLNNPTIAVHDRLAAQGYPVALTLQA